MTLCARSISFHPRCPTAALWRAVATLLFVMPMLARAQAAGITGLGVLGDGIWSRAYGVSADGTAVVGVSTDGSPGNDARAFYWTQAAGSGRSEPSATFVPQPRR